MDVLEKTILYYTSGFPGVSYFEFCCWQFRWCKTTKDDCNLPSVYQKG